MRQQTYKKIMGYVCIIPLLLFTGCSQSGLSEYGGTQEQGKEQEKRYRLTDADTDVTVNNPVEIQFDANQSIYVIEKPGDYLLQGEYNGQIQVDAQDEIVHLILENVEMKSQEGPVIYVKSAAKVVITIPEGSSSTLMDSANYKNFADAEACIYSVDDLTINGGGNLQVYGYYQDAIRTRDTLKLLDVNLSVKSKDTGVRGNDGVVLRTETFEIQCEGTGIYTEREEKKPERGFVDIAGGTVEIIAGMYGIDAGGDVFIHDCTADIQGVVQNISCSGMQYVEEGCLE